MGCRKNVQRKKVQTKEKKPYTPFPPPQQPSKVSLLAPRACILLAPACSADRCLILFRNGSLILPSERHEACVGSTEHGPTLCLQSNVARLLLTFAALACSAVPPKGPLSPYHRALVGHGEHPRSVSARVPVVYLPSPVVLQVDLQLESGEYFLSASKRQAKSRAEKDQKQSEKAEERKQQREAAFVPPKVSRHWVPV